MYVVGGFLGYQWADFDCDFEMTFLCEEEVNPAVAWKKKKKRRRKIEDGQLDNFERHENFENAWKSEYNRLESHKNFENQLKNQHNVENSQDYKRKAYESANRRADFSENALSSSYYSPEKSDFERDHQYSNSEFASSFIKEWGQENDDDEQTFTDFQSQRRIHHGGKLIGGDKEKYDFPPPPHVNYDENENSAQKVEKVKKGDDMWSLWSIVRRVKNVLALQ